MLKKFLAVIALVALFTTSTASALDPVGKPGAAAANDFVTGFAVSSSKINPAKGETVTVSYTLTADANMYVYALNNTTFDVIEIEGAAVAPIPKKIGPVTHTFFGKKPNTAAGTALADGAYTVKAFATVGAVTESESVAITVETVSPNAPKVTNVKATPVAFSAATDESSEISFNVDKDAYLTVEVQKSVAGVYSTIKTFSNYDGNDFYKSTATHSVSWNGEDNSGTVVVDGTYQIKVTAKNDDGTVSATGTVEVKTNAPVTSGTIKDLKLDPSGTWDPTDEELVIEFELTEDADTLTVEAKKGNKVVEIVDDEDADDDDYEEAWDGTDDDGDYVDEGTWEIIVRADGSKASKTVTVKYDQPDVASAFVTKSSFDPSEGEFTVLVFKVDTASVVTIEVFKGNSKELTLVKNEDVKKNKWYFVGFDGMDKNGDEVDFGNDWKFKITAENATDDDISAVSSVEFDVEEDDASDKKANITNDYVFEPVFDDNFSSSVSLSYTIDEEAEVYAAVYEGNSTSGKAEAELLDYVSQTAGSHVIDWNVTDSKGKSLKDGIYSYKIISKANGNYKETETGQFVVGNTEGFMIEPPTVPACNDGVDNDFDGWADYGYDPGCDSYEDNDEYDDYEYTPACNDGIDNDYDGWVDYGEDPGCDSWDDYDEYDYVEPTCGKYIDTKNLGVKDWEMCAAIEWASSQGIFDGYADGSFGPYNNINRAEVLKVALEAFDNAVILPSDGSNQGFKDLDSSAWYMPYVRTAKFYGMLHGYPDGEAKLNQNINRVEMLKFMLEASKSFVGTFLQKYAFSYFADVDANDPNQAWYIDYAGAAHDYLLFNTDYDYNTSASYLKPAKLVTRGEVALMLYRMNQYGLLGYYDFGYEEGGKGYYKGYY